MNETKKIIGGEGGHDLMIDEQAKFEVAVDYPHCRHIAPIKVIQQKEGRTYLLVEGLPKMSQPLMNATAKVIRAWRDSPLNGKDDWLRDQMGELIKAHEVALTWVIPDPQAKLDDLRKAAQRLLDATGKNIAVDDKDELALAAADLDIALAATVGIEESVVSGPSQAAPEQAMRELLEKHDPLKPQLHHCDQCGLPLIVNPHPDAGKPGHLLEVGCPLECLPCKVASRHAWSKRALAAELKLRALAAPSGAPIQMILHCPKCGLQHVDAPDERKFPAFGPGMDVTPWTNPPHKSHLCHGCGNIWRPADVPTEGVKAIKTSGKNDSPVEQCEACNGTGLVGHPPDDYFDCPGCTFPRAASTVQSAPVLPENGGDTHESRLAAIRATGDQNLIAAVLNGTISIRDAVAKARAAQSTPVPPAERVVYRIDTARPKPCRHLNADGSCDACKGSRGCISRPEYEMMAIPDQSTPVQVEGQQEQTFQPSCDSALCAEPGSQHGVDLAAEVERLKTAKCHLIQQAKMWRFEARAQRATVLGILRRFGLPQHDWEAKRLLVHHVQRLIRSADVAHPHSAGSARQGGEHAPEIVQAVALPVAAAQADLIAMIVDRDTPPDDRNEVIDHDINGKPITRGYVAKAAAPEKKQ